MHSASPNPPTLRALPPIEDEGKREASLTRSIDAARFTLFHASRGRRPQNRSVARRCAFALLALIGVSSRAMAANPASTESVKVLKSYPHDAGAFTQGFELDPANPGQYIESTGHYGRSTLRRVDLNTGKVLQQVPLERRHFGEGLTLVGDKILQLTWRAGEALRYDARNFTPIAPWTYEGEGWGLCFDGKTLWMSDGSDTLSARSPVDFSLQRTIAVRYNGKALAQLNELECARGRVYANVWHQDWVAEIDPQSGQVTRRIDAASLRKQAGDYAGTLNGIAYRSKTGTFLLTGKNWSKIFEVDIALAADPAHNSGTSKPAQPGHPKPAKKRGCAFFSAKRPVPLGFLLSLGVLVGGLASRRGTAKCASDGHV